MIVSARSILGIDTISKGNNKPWDKLMDYMATQPSGMPVEFDFRGIEVNQPCTSMSFMKILANPDFRMTIYNNDTTVESIHMMCIINGYDRDRIKNINDVVPKVPTPEEKAIERMANQLMSYFVTNDTGTKGTLNIHSRFDQIGQPQTVKYIEAAIDKYCKDTGVKDVEVYTKMMVIQPGVVDTIVEMINNFGMNGIEVYFRCDDVNNQNVLDMGLVLSKASYSKSEKFNLMKARLKKGRVGIIAKYKEGRAKDQFGRQGRGEVVMTRVAIFKGFVNVGGTVRARFRTFNSNKLYTRDHWFLEHDRETLDSLEYNDIEVDIDEIGIYNDFIGTKYHFSACIQYSHDGSTKMFRTTPTGGVVGDTVTIPERAKMVFDDFEVEYEEESLNEYIEETRRILNSIEM